MPEEYYDEDGFRLLFEDDIEPEEKQYYMGAYPNVSKIAEQKIHCTSCQTHIGTAPMALAIIRMHPVLRVTHCRACHAFYNSGEFDKGEDGSELYCRWCGQGGEVYCCSNCPYVFCKSCISKNLSASCVFDIGKNENWDCFGCAPQIMWHLRAQHWALVNFIEKQKKEIKTQPQLTAANIDNLLKRDLTTCCQNKGAHRWKGNQSTSTASGSKKQPKRAGVHDDADNVPLAKLRNNINGSGESGIQKEKKSLEPMVVIPPIPSAFLPKEKASSSTANSTKLTYPKQQKKLKHKQSARTSVESQEQSQSPPPKRTKKSNAEVVCTPDIMSMFNQMAMEVQPTPSTSQTSNGPRGVMAAGSSRNISDNPKAGPVPVTPVSPTPVPMYTSAQKPKAILHKSLGRNLTVRVGPIEATSSAQANQVEEPTMQSARGPPTVATKESNLPPMYHTFGGYRIDLISAAQHGTYRLPNGKFIQVRKQTTDPQASTAGSSNVVPDGAVRAPGEKHNGPNSFSLEQANRTALAHPQVNMQVVRATPPQVYTPLLQQQSTSSTMSPTVQQTRSYIPQQTPQHQQQLQHQPLVQQQVHQQALQRNQHPGQPQLIQQQQLQHQQLQQVNQQLQQEIQQRPRIRTPAPRGRPPKQRQQPHPRIQPYPVPSRPVSGMPNTEANAATRVVAQQQNQQQNPPNPPQTASAQVHQPILHLLRGLVEAPHENSPLGAARKDFEEKLVGCVEACNHIVVKIHSLTQSNSFKTIRNLRDLKELFIHLSYLITYGIGRFNSLHDRCVADVKKMGFTKPSDFVMMGEKINNRNPEDSDDDDDCEIVEENTTVIQVDSDDEQGTGGGRAGPIANTAADNRNSAERVLLNPLPNTSKPPSTEGSVRNATSVIQRSMPNDSTVSTIPVESGPEESIGSRQPTTAEAEEHDKTKVEFMTTSLENGTMEGCVSGQNDEGTEPMQVRETATESGLERGSKEGARTADITERNELLPPSEMEKHPNPDQTPPEPSLENETIAPVRQAKLPEPAETLETDEGTVKPNSKQNDAVEPMEAVEGTIQADLTERAEPSEVEKQPTAANLETEIIKPAEQNETMEVLESSSGTLQCETIEPAKEKEIPELVLLDFEEEIQSLSDQSSSSASIEKETKEVAEENNLTGTCESLLSDENDGPTTKAAGQQDKETIESAEENNVIEPMESVETEGDDRTKAVHSNIPTLEAGSKEKTATVDENGSLQEERIERMEVCEPVVGSHFLPLDFGSASDEEKLDKLLSETLSVKNDEIPLSSWGSIENIMAGSRKNAESDTPQKAQKNDGERGSCPSESVIASIANATGECSKSDESVRPASVSEDGNGKDVKEDAQQLESTSASCSRGKLKENEISNAETVQNAHPLASDKLHSDANGIVEGESHEKQLAAGLNDSAKQPSSDLSATNDEQDGSTTKQRANVCEGNQLSDKEAVGEQDNITF